TNHAGGGAFSAAPRPPLDLAASRPSSFSNGEGGLTQAHSNRLRHFAFPYKEIVYPEHFEHIFADSLELATFRTHCIASFTVPACLFYERAIALHRRYGLDNPTRATPAHQITQLVDELEALYADYFSRGASLPLFGVLTDRTAQKLENSFARREMRVDLLNDAMAEIKCYLYLWAYPSYAALLSSAL
ncbi:hypothetical protein THASP1DRAFT_33599, partial [Thamnocephalis sphaerospora]